MEYKLQKSSDSIAVLKALIALSVPTIMEQLLSTLLQYVDTAMVGQLGEQATASISVTTNINWLVNSVPSALATAALAMIARAVGGKDSELIRRITGKLVAAVIGIGVILGTVCVVMAPFIPGLMGAEEAIHKPASTYFIIVSVPVIFRAASSVFGAAIRATQNTKTPMLINFGSNCINVVLNLIFIYGLNLGVMGAAIGSAVAYTAGGVVMYVFFRKNKLLWPENVNISGDKTKDDIVVKELARLSIPVLGTNVVSCLGYVFFAGMVSGMGTTIFAAHSIAVTAETIFYMPGHGLRIATSAMVGLFYGEKDEKKLHTVSRISVIFTMLMMVVTGTILFLCAYPLMRLFTSSEQVACIGADMLRIVAFTEPFFGLMVVLEGIFYGLGRTRYPFFAESASMWGIRILFTFLCVKVWGLGLANVWYCMIADNICKALLLALPFIFRRRKMLSVNN